MSNDHSTHNEEEPKWLDLESENERATLPVSAVPYIMIGIVIMFVVCVRLYIVSSGGAH